MIIAPLVLLAFTQSASSSPAPAPQTAAPQTVAPQTAVPPPAAAEADPARLAFPVDSAGLVLVAVKPDRTADYEAMIQALHEALAGGDAAARRIGGGWRVYKAADADAKGNALYVHLVSTPLADADYRPSVVLNQLARELPADLLVKYRDAFAGAVTRLSLSMLADLSLAPVVKPKD